MAVCCRTSIPGGRVVPWAKTNTAVDGKAAEPDPTELTSSYPATPHTPRSPVPSKLDGAILDGLSSMAQVRWPMLDGPMLAELAGSFTQGQTSGLHFCQPL